MNNKKSNREWLIKIPKLNTRQVDMLYLVLLTVGFIIGIVFFFKIIVNIVIKLLGVIISLVQLWALNSSDKYILFFGGIFFLIVGYKIFEAITIIWVKVMSHLLGEIKIKGKKNE